METKKTVNLVANVIAPLAVVAVTVAMFFVFGPPEPGTLFWINMVYSVLLEVILFAYIVWLPTANSGVALKWMQGVGSTIYICASIIWMLIYWTLLSSQCSIGTYVVVIALLTVLWIFFGALTQKAGIAHQEQVASLTDNRRRLDAITARADMLLQRFRLRMSAHPDMAEAAPAVTALCRALATLSPTVMGDHDAAASITAICADLENLLSQPYCDGSAVQLKDFAQQSNITLNCLKKSTRK